MKTGKIISDLRKGNGWSQTELATKTDISQVMVGKYERGDAIPSIEVAKRIADAFSVSLDYLVGEGQNASFDKRTLDLVQEIEALEPSMKERLLYLANAVIRDYKTQKAYS